jgi:hypothetical protein
MIMRPNGATRTEIVAATDWPSVSIAQIAASTGLDIITERTGREIRYRINAVAATPPSPTEMQSAPAYSALSPTARRILAIIGREIERHGGNEPLPLTYDRFEVEGINRTNIPAAIRELAALKFVVVNIVGKTNHFRLTQGGDAMTLDQAKRAAHLARVSTKLVKRKVTYYGKQPKPDDDAAGKAVSKAATGRLDNDMVHQARPITLAKIPWPTKEWND